MAKTRLSKATYVERGYGQVEPNHLSAQRTAQIYAQLPAKGDIDVLENGQFVKYNYAQGVCDFAGAGEWMLVFNPVKLYRDNEGDADFAMIKENYAAQVYSPITGNVTTYNAVDWSGIVTSASQYEADSTSNPMVNASYEGPALMPATEDGKASTMVPRVFKTNVGDIFTTNTVMATELSVGQVLTPGADGYLTVGEGEMKWQVVKVYNLPDRQKAVKIMRIA